MSKTRCSVCPDIVGKGGRKGKDGKPPLCVRHYHRMLRGSPAALVPGAVKADSVHTSITLDRALHRLLTREARATGASISSVISDALGKRFSW